MREDLVRIRADCEAREILTIPQPNHTVPTATNECIPPELYGTYKILVHFPSTVGVRWSRNGEGSNRRRGSREERAREPGRGSSRRVRDRPKDVHGHYALSRREIPLTHRLIRSAGHLHASSVGSYGRSGMNFRAHKAIVLEVHRSHSFTVPFQCPYERTFLS